MMSICDEIDMKLGTFGADSIFQKARSLSYEERQLVDELFRQALVGKDLDIRAAEKISGVSVRRVERKIPDLRRRLEIALELAQRGKLA
jgi:hypothetical protein